MFSRIHTEYGYLRSKALYSVQMRENADQKTLNIDTFCAVHIRYLLGFLFYFIFFIISRNLESVQLLDFLSVFKFLFKTLDKVAGV